MIDDQSVDASEPWQSLEMLKEGRKTMLLMAIGVLESVTPQREMHAGLEVLHAALDDLDDWERGMAEIIRRDIAASLLDLPVGLPSEVLDGDEDH